MIQRSLNVIHTSSTSRKGLVAGDFNIVLSLIQNDTLHKALQFFFLWIIFEFHLMITKEFVI